MKLYYYIFGIVNSLLQKLAVASNQGAENEGKFLGISGTGEVIPIEGDPTSATAGDIPYSSSSTYSEGTVGAELTEQKSQITALGLSVVDGALCQTYTA